MSYKAYNVPETGFEPAHPFGRHHLKVVRLPISPPGLEGCKNSGFPGSFLKILDNKKRPPQPSEDGLLSRVTTLNPNPVCLPVSRSS